jgi:RNA polymerase sporulation-specific sigma factor
MRSDEQLALAVQAGDAAAADELVVRYHDFAGFLASPFATARSDRDDMRQEALLGILAAAAAFRRDAGASFRTFAALVIRRRLYTVIKSDTCPARSSAQAPLSIYTVLETESGELILQDAIADPHAREPFAIICEQDQIRRLTDVVLNQMSPLERESLLGLVFNGESYAEVEARINGFDGSRVDRATYTPVKVVDNAIMRARLKLRRALVEGQAA